MQPIDTVRATSSSYADTATARIRQTFKPSKGWSKTAEEVAEAERLADDFDEASYGAKSLSECIADLGPEADPFEVSEVRESHANRVREGRRLRAAADALQQPPIYSFLDGSDGDTGELTASELRRLKRRGITHINLELLDSEGWPLGTPDFSVAELLEAIDPLERGPEESRDFHIGRLLRLWEKLHAAHPYAKATAATWDALIVAAFDKSEAGTYFGYGDWKGRACLGQVTRRAKVRGGGGAFRNVCRSYRKSGGWTKGR